MVLCGPSLLTVAGNGTFLLFNIESRLASNLKCSGLLKLGLDTQPLMAFQAVQDAISPRARHMTQVPLV